MAIVHKILFLGETYRADAITWMNGLKEFGPFEIVTWELEQGGTGLKKVKRAFELLRRLQELKRLIKKEKPALIIAERVTSYGFIASLFYKYAPVVVAQQGITDIYPPGSFMVPIKKAMQRYAFKQASLIHAWGEIMTYSMLKAGTDPNKIMVLAKGIDLRQYQFVPAPKDNTIRAIVTRSLTPDYRHETILGAFAILKKAHIPFELILIGDGILKEKLKQSAIDKNIEEEVVFAGRIPNNELPRYLGASDLYISMPCTEGVSASLFEAMAAGCYPIVTDLPGNRAWIMDGINGRLIKVDDVRALAEAINWYANNRVEQQGVLLKNREMIETKISFEKNMKTISERYHALIDNHALCAE
jgi:glycosyltransferase involved in cell wall biosynthesis